MPHAAGHVINNRYRIVKLLGQGGFGAVYRAWDINLNRPCALKENLATDLEAARQFEREARLLANLNHPNLARVTDYFILAGQGQYLVMDLIDGQDLQSMLDSVQPPTAPTGMLPPFQGNSPDAIGLSESQVLPWISQVCDALSYLHSQKPPVIHRDIKPANIRINSQGKAVLVDFGIAKLYDPQHQTTAGARAYTPGYSPPEQYGAGRTDARSDIYALGATTYSLLTGHRPPESIEIVTNRAATPLPAHLANPTVSVAAGQAIEQAMQINTMLRPTSASEYKVLLIGQLSVPVIFPAPPVQAMPLQQPIGPTWQQSAQLAQQRPKWLIPAILVGAAIVILTISILMGRITSGGSDADRQATENALVQLTQSYSTLLPINPSATITQEEQVGSTFPPSEATTTETSPIETATIVQPAFTTTPWHTPSLPPTIIPGIYPLTGNGLVRLTFGDGNFYRAVLSPNQRRLISFADQNKGFQIVEVDPNGGGFLEQISASGSIYHHPTFSADGQTLLVANNQTGPFKIYLMNAATGELLQQLTDGPGNDMTPFWFPDGQRFAYQSDRDGDTEIYIGYLDGRQPDKLTDNDDFDGTSVVSPDGERIAFYSTRNGNPDIFVMIVDSLQTWQLTNTSSREAEPWFTPDGQWIVFESNNSGNYDIWAIRTDGSELHQVTDSSDREQMPTVSPDGLWIIYSSKEGEGYDLFRTPWK